MNQHKLPDTGFKKISKEFEICHSTVGKIVHKWKTAANMPRSGRPNKLTPRADVKMLKVGTKKPYGIYSRLLLLFI
uniref:Transposase Tc1-like domain-containing protein n=1 Tax=Mola mola TaxID=94237 RepID=A0A3Q3W386_MOLML